MPKQFSITNEPNAHDFRLWEEEKPMQLFKERSHWVFILQLHRCEATVLTCSPKFIMQQNVEIKFYEKSCEAPTLVAAFCCVTVWKEEENSETSCNQKQTRRVSVIKWKTKTDPQKQNERKEKVGLLSESAWILTSAQVFVFATVIYRLHITLVKGFVWKKGIIPECMHFDFICTCLRL